MEVLVERLKWLREKKRLGQKEVSGNIGVTLSGYQKMEYGESNPKIETLIKIAKYFKVRTDFLLGLSDQTSEMERLAGNLNKVSVVLKFKKLDLLDLISKIDNHEIIAMKRNIEDLEETFKSGLSEYIQELYEVPMNNPHEDDWLISGAPYICETNFDKKIGKWELDVFDKDNYNLITYVFDNDAEYELESEKITKYFTQVKPPMYNFKQPNIISEI